MIQRRKRTTSDILPFCVPFGVLSLVGPGITRLSMWGVATRTLLNEEEGVLDFGR